MKLSDAVAQHLAAKGIKVIFGYQGGSITHLIDSFSRYGIQYIQSYNEQGAGLAADAFARVSKSGVGVAIGTNGPGATNLITAIANAYCDSIPVIFITGQVHTLSMKKSHKIRQESFQEIDIIAMISSITKYCVTVMDKNRVLDEIDKAFDIALEGRKGPVVLDFPVDIQGMDIDVNEFSDKQLNVNLNKVKGVYKSYIRAMVRAIKEAAYPLIIAGGGIRKSDSVEEFRLFVSRADIPVVTSLMGLDVLNHDDRNFVGLIGTYGNRYANLALQDSDLLIVMGSRLDPRQTGKMRGLFAPKARIIHIDIDEEELGHYIDGEIKILCDLKNFLIELNSAIESEEFPDISAWIEIINKLKNKYPSDKEFDESKENNPNLFMKKLGEFIPENAVVTFDVGQNQMWAAQSLRIRGEHVHILNSGGLGVMGYSLPAGIGAYFATTDRPVISLMGDGGLQMNIQELQMIAHYKLPMKVVVIRNNALGLIRDIHEKYYKKKYIGSVEGFSVPPLDLVAGVYNMKYIRIKDIKDIFCLEYIFRDSYAYMVEILIEGETYVRPELLGTDGLDKQSPYIS